MPYVYKMVDIPNEVDGKSLARGAEKIIETVVSASSKSNSALRLAAFSSGGSRSQCSAASLFFERCRKIEVFGYS